MKNSISAFFIRLSAIGAATLCLFCTGCESGKKESPPADAGKQQTGAEVRSASQGSLPAAGQDRTLFLQEMDGVMKSFADAYKSKNLSRMLALYADTPSVFLIGDGGQRGYPGRKEIAEAYADHFASFDVMDFITFQIVTADTEGAVAWLVAKVSAAILINGTNIKIDGWCSAVLKRVDKEWLFLQTHLSYPPIAP